MLVENLNAIEQIGDRDLVGFLVRIHVILLVGKRSGRKKLRNKETKEMDKVGFSFVGGKRVMTIAKTIIRIANVIYLLSVSYMAITLFYLSGF